MFFWVNSDFVFCFPPKPFSPRSCNKSSAAPTRAESSRRRPRQRSPLTLDSPGPAMACCASCRACWDVSSGTCGAQAGEGETITWGWITQRGDDHLDQSWPNDHGQLFPFNGTLVRGNVDQNLRNPSCLSLSHTHMEISSF